MSEPQASGPRLLTAGAVGAPPTWAEDQVEHVRWRLENADSIRSIAGDLGLSPYVFKDAVLAHRIPWPDPQQRRHVRSSQRPGARFFDEIDDEASAYALGLIVADGYIGQGPRRERIGFEVSARDSVLADWLAEQLGGTVVTRHRPNLREPGKYWTMRSMRAGGVHLVGALADKGVAPRKSQAEDGTEPLRHVSNDLFPHFLRGLFDGDGSAFVNQRGRVVVELCGNRMLMAALQRRLCAVLGLQRAAVAGDANAVQVFGKVRWVHPLDTWRLYRFMYDDATIGLERKESVLARASTMLHDRGSPYRGVAYKAHKRRWVAATTIGPEGRRVPVRQKHHRSEIEAARTIDAWLAERGETCPRNLIPDPRFTPPALPPARPGRLRPWADRTPFHVERPSR